MPNSIRDSEKPDFVLEFDSRVVGIEITLAVEGEYVRAQRLYILMSLSSLQTSMIEGCAGRLRRIAAEIRSNDVPWKSSDEEMNRLAREGRDEE